MVIKLFGYQCSMHGSVPKSIHCEINHYCKIKLRQRIILQHNFKLKKYTLNISNTKNPGTNFMSHDEDIFLSSSNRQPGWEVWSNTHEDPKEVCCWNRKRLGLFVTNGNGVKVEWPVAKLSGFSIPNSCKAILGRPMGWAIAHCSHFCTVQRRGALSSWSCKITWELQSHMETADYATES